MGRFKTQLERDAKAAKKPPRRIRRGVSKAAVAQAAQQAIAMLKGEK